MSDSAAFYFKISKFVASGRNRSNLDAPNGEIHLWLGVLSELLTVVSTRRLGIDRLLHFRMSMISLAGLSSPSRAPVLLFGKV